MNNNEEVFLTDEELDEIVGGGSRVYKYELCHNDKKGDYYRCYIYTDGLPTGTRNVGVDRWAEFQEKVKLMVRGATFVAKGK